MYLNRTRVLVLIHLISMLRYPQIKPRFSSFNPQMTRLLLSHLPYFLLLKSEYHSLLVLQVAARTDPAGHLLGRLFDADDLAVAQFHLGVVW